MLGMFSKKDVAFLDPAGPGLSKMNKSELVSGLLRACPNKPYFHVCAFCLEI
jgi:hypothetical protein